MWDRVFDMMLWGAVLMAAVVVLFAGVWAARRYWLGAVRHGQAPGAPLSIEKVEQMHRQGLISREEFSTLRRAALGLAPPAPARKDSGLSCPRPRDDVKDGPEDSSPDRPKEQE